MRSDDYFERDLATSVALHWLPLQVALRHRKRRVRRRQHARRAATGGRRSCGGWQPWMVMTTMMSRGSRRQVLFLACSPHVLRMLCALRGVRRLSRPGGVEGPAGGLQKGWQSAPVSSTAVLGWHAAAVAMERSATACALHAAHFYMPYRNGRVARRDAGRFWRLPPADWKAAHLAPVYCLHPALCPTAAGPVPNLPTALVPCRSRRGVMMRMSPRRAQKPTRAMKMTAGGLVLEG